MVNDFFTSGHALVLTWVGLHIAAFGISAFALPPG